ncbi:MAG: FAD-dependent oxidoreductase [Pseudomonadota bacterium]
MHVAIIGAGMTGLTAARHLRDAGVDVKLYDKGRGPGGRMSTRRAQIDEQTVRFDHGAQYISPESEAFAKEVERWVEAGVAANWTGRMVSMSEDGRISDRDPKPAFVGRPGMNEIIRHLSIGLDVQWAKRVQTVSYRGGWQLLFETGEIETGFDRVLIAVPAEQVSDLVAEVSETIAAEARAIRSAPCWTLMTAFEERLKPTWDAVSIEGQPISWAARNSSKPIRHEMETWVLQASPDWSTAHLEDDKEHVAQTLLSAFEKIVGAARPIFATAHRWRYSQVEPMKSPLYYFDADIGLGACGDWCSGPKVEDAWRSGQALAKRVLM